MKWAGCPMLLSCDGVRNVAGLPPFAFGRTWDRGNGENSVPSLTPTLQAGKTAGYGGKTEKDRLSN